MGKTFRVGKDLICGELKIKRWDEYVVALRKGLKLKELLCKKCHSGRTGHSSCCIAVASLDRRVVGFLIGRRAEVIHSEILFKFS